VTDLSAQLFISISAAEDSAFSSLLNSRTAAHMDDDWAVSVQDTAEAAVSKMGLAQICGPLSASESAELLRKSQTLKMANRPLTACMQQQAWVE